MSTSMYKKEFLKNLVVEIKDYRINPERSEEIDKMVGKAHLRKKFFAGESTMKEIYWILRDGRFKRICYLDGGQRHIFMTSFLNIDKNPKSAMFCVYSHGEITVNYGHEKHILLQTHNTKELIREVRRLKRMFT